MNRTKNTAPTKNISSARGTPDMTGGVKYRSSNTHHPWATLNASRTAMSAATIIIAGSQSFQPAR
jgi:hypothetical protein